MLAFGVGLEILEGGLATDSAMEGTLVGHSGFIFRS